MQMPDRPKDLTITQRDSRWHVAQLTALNANGTCLVQFWLIVRTAAQYRVQ